MASRITLPRSSYLDFTSYGTTTATTVEEAYRTHGLLDLTGSDQTLNVALILPRANDPSALLAADWATRQATLAQLERDGTLWSTYGASIADFTAAMAELKRLGIAVLGDATGSGGYITSAESRTIWVQLTPAQFLELFGQRLYEANGSTSGMTFTLQFWNGLLSLPDTIRATGIWFDTAPPFGIFPAVSDLSGGVVATPPQGPQSIGNGLAHNGQYSKALSGDMAKWFYNFPLKGRPDVVTATVGLVEPGIGDAVPPPPPPRKDLAPLESTFQQGLDGFRAYAGLGPGSYYSVANGRLEYDNDNANSVERSLDVGVVASAAPGSTMGLYGGSGFGNGANSNTFTAYQAAVWDRRHNPPVISSSYGIFQQSAPDSPFSRAIDELFIDGALRNITTFWANNDWGSSYGFANGIANQNINLSSPYAVLVGGTSISTVEAAPKDPSLASLYAQAMAGDPATLWGLMQAGLRTLPSSVQGSPAAFRTLLESVWNVWSLKGDLWKPGFSNGDVGGASDGGVDLSQPTPSYQTAFGLTPTSVNPGGGTGRGAPDVAANSGGNLWYIAPSPSMQPPYGDDFYWGTSAASPLWAALMAQINTVFQDQGLPNLGYANDLLYIAAAISPASFNDITQGNNIASWLVGGPIKEPLPSKDEGPRWITLTGYGYAAGPGYDLTTGLGSPNGTLLARALSAIAHQQTTFAAIPDILNHDSTTPVAQTLLVQPTSNTSRTVTVVNGDSLQSHAITPSARFAWTSRLAQQSLQSDFDPALVRLFDGQAQAAPSQSQAGAGGKVAVLIDGSPTQTPQVTLTNPFGFVDFVSGSTDSSVRLARPVAVAETVGGLDDQSAVIRIRQNGADQLSLRLYQVDDLTGSIHGLHPGDPGYAAAAEARSYVTPEGSTTINGPGFGNYTQTLVNGVDAGDLIAMQLTNHTESQTYWAFAQANEIINGEPVSHLWNYGHNTWGWEDRQGGGDRDYNDLIVGIDFTSAYGQGWLV